MHDGDAHSPAGSEAAEDWYRPTDPAYWQRVLGDAATEGGLFTDPAVDAAIRSGRPRAVYRVLKKRVNSVPTLRAREALRAALAKRRLFLEPNWGPPGVGHLCGIGTSVHGSQEFDPKGGTFVTTAFFTLLFLPVWPLAQYLAARAHPRGLRVYGRVPMSDFHRGWRWVVVACVATLLLTVALPAWQRSRSSSVHFLNGLPFAVEVVVADDVVPVPAHGRAVRTLTPGRYHLVARRPEGPVLEEYDVEVPTRTDLVAYNVLGAAPLLVVRVIYAREGIDQAQGEEQANPRSFAGVRWVLLDGVEYVFREPDPRVESSSVERTFVRRHADTQAGGWQAGLEQLVAEGNTSGAAELARRLARVLPEDESAVWVALELTEREGKPKATRAFLNDVLEAAPSSVPAHRALQTHMKWHGEGEAALDRYREALASDPESPRAGYLFACVASFEDALPVCERFLETHPDDVPLRRALAWILFQSTRFDEAIPHYRRLLDLAPDSAGRYSVPLATALAAQGKPGAALGVLSSIFDAAPARASLDRDPFAGARPDDLLVSYGALRRGVPPDAPFPSLEERLREMTGLNEPDVHGLASTAAIAQDAACFESLRPRMDDTELVSCCVLTLRARDDVAAAARSALESEPAALAGLRDETKLAIACELDRMGQTMAAASLLAGVTPELAHYVTLDDLKRLPELSEIDPDLDLRLQAVLHYAASRREDDETRKAELVAKARVMDPLRLVVPDE